MVTGTADFATLAGELVETARAFYARGWAFGTSGNYSAVWRREPLRLAITASGLDKGRLAPEAIVEVDGDGAVVAGDGRPSDETRIHLAVVRERSAGSVLHTHSVWNTLLSRAGLGEGGVTLEGYEMLKGLAGVSTHEHREWVPVVANAQDYDSLSREVTETLRQNPQAHGLLLSGHGLYAWGRDLAEARRHVEILEFLFEVEGRRRHGG
jgi:methylthioribulose-1-phosphate dehydratase